ncbi:hypothetical protein [Marinobacter sp. AC-23]|uniref:hypothetical protein n=1 Tax=Marinobacter sp. AC-23 TaxID=1879031 RepID=UPI0008DEA3A3|nr:hypothetical protein [Marinobacter sp. AC-23]OHY73515.1 hypothetical protein BCA33_18640 [Marinobacter sp. AC-23]
MEVFEKLFILMMGLFLPLSALADGPGRMGDGMMGGDMILGMGTFMMVIWLFLIALLVLAILALIKYLRKK